MESAQHNDTGSKAVEPLEAWRLAVVDLFVHATQSLGLPRSLGQIYGLLFTLEEPVDMDRIRDQLGISKGSASQGLRILRQFGAVRSVFVVGERREHFVAETSLRRLISGFSNEVVEPHLESGTARLHHIKALVEALPPDQRGMPSERAKTLASWHEKMRRLVPLVRNFL
mgnify:CR=1 FL=1